ncbi:MAG: cAMP receptor protein [Deltaproteobacteria bacterium ADurb.Bin510]|nr:MAG: cAMP receptor protein [Deltaproteobacteria bacterium ADurb.Bin510]
MQQIENLASQLGQAAMFEVLPPAALRQLAGQCTVEQLTPGDMLFNEGSPGQAFFLMQTGDVKIFKTAPDGREVVLRLLTPGSIFGEVVLFENLTYPVNATALSAATVIRIPRTAFLRLLEDEGLRNAFIGRLMEKQRYLTERLVYLTAYDVEERFVRFLVERYGRHAEFEVDLSKKEIAGLIGTIPETFSRLINRLKIQGNLVWEGSRLSFSPGFVESFLFED